MVNKYTPTNEAVIAHKKILNVMNIIIDYLEDGGYNKTHSKLTIDNILREVKDYDYQH